MIIAYYHNTLFSSVINRENQARCLNSTAVAELYLLYKDYNSHIETEGELCIAENKFNIFLNEKIPYQDTNIEIKVILIDYILGNAKNGNQLDGLTFNIGNSYIIIISRESSQSMGRLLLHELVHIIVSIYHQHDYEQEYEFVEALVEQYVDELWGSY